MTFTDAVVYFEAVILVFPSETYNDSDLLALASIETDAFSYETKFPVLPSAKSLLQLALCSAETILNVPTIEVKSVEETAILPDFTLVSIL